MDIIFSGVQYGIVISLLYVFSYTYVDFGNLAFWFMLGVIFALPNQNTFYGLEWHIRRWNLGYELNNSNPIFEKGLFREKTGSKFWGDLKVHFYCQMMLMAAVPINAAYFLLFYCGKMQRNYIMEITFTFILAIIVMARLIFDIYCYRYYVKCFRYAKDRDGIWKPFSFIARAHGMQRYNPFVCNYLMEYDDVKKQLIKKSKSVGYDKSVLYNMKHGEEALFFTKREKETLDILILLRIKEYRDEYVDYYNMIFKTYWKNYIHEKELVKTESVIFLMCIDEWTAEFGKRFDRIVSVDQENGKNRLPVFLIQEEQPVLHILCNRSCFRGKEKYWQMRKEILWMLGLSERDNEKMYSARGKRC